MTTVHRVDCRDKADWGFRPSAPLSQQQSQKDLMVAAYCRVSTVLDSQSGSIEAQRRHYERLISETPGWSLAGIYLESGVSGTDAQHRPELQRLLADCCAGSINLVLTKSISRFARNTAECIAMVRTLDAIGVRIRFEKENILTGTGDSELMLSLFACLAAEESRSISDNMKWAARKRFASGTYRSGRTPYGYTRVDGALHIVPHEACVVEQIFLAAQAGSRPAKIARTLNEQGQRTRQGNKWWPSSIRLILSNPVYAGDMLFQKTYMDAAYTQQPNRGELDRYYVRGHHSAIVSRELFAQVNKEIPWMSS